MTDTSQTRDDRAGAASLAGDARSPQRLLEGKVALVTGAAHGNGAAIARAFARQGADVALADVDEAAAIAESERIRSETGRQSVALYADVAVETEAVRIVEETIDAFSRLDILVNNAGVLTIEPFLEMSRAAWEKTHAVNVNGAMFSTQAAARWMATAGGGSIVNITSVGAEIAAPGLAAYCSSKGALQMLTRATALELAPLGIRVNAIAPGLILTAMAKRLYDSEESLAEIVARIPLGRPGRPNDLVGAALYLASDLSAYVTGTTVLVDGGLLLT